MVSGVRGGDGLGIRGVQLSFCKGRLAWADRLLVAVKISVGLQELNASTVAMHVAEAADIHEDVKAEAVSCAEGSEKLVVASTVLRAQPEKF
jgi:hypothetical protein